MARSTSKTTTNSKKPPPHKSTTTTTGKSKSKSRGRTAQDEEDAMFDDMYDKFGGVASEDEEEEEEEEEMEEDDDDDLAAAGEGGDSTTIAETQYDQDSTTAKKGKKVVPKKGSTTTNPKSSNKRKATEEIDHIDDVAGENGATGPTAKETKLMAQLNATKKTLAEVQAQFKKLSELKHTRAEEAEARLRTIADERQTAAANTIAAYKNEADTLRAEIASLQTTAYASPRSKAAQVTNKRIVELEQINVELAARQEELEGKLEEREAYWKKKMDSEIKARENEWSSRQRQLEADLQTVQNDYETEVTHSKSLQAKLKSSSSLPTTSTMSTSSKDAEEHESTRRKLELSEDLTGFTVHSVRQDPEGSTYICSLVDCWGTEEKSLQFDMVFHDNAQVSYKPHIDATRDQLLVAVLPPELRNYMRFEADRCGEWFKRLHSAVNKQPR